MRSFKDLKIANFDAYVIFVIQYLKFLKEDLPDIVSKEIMAYNYEKEIINSEYFSQICRALTLAKDEGLEFDLIEILNKLENIKKSLVA